MRDDPITKAIQVGGWVRFETIGVNTRVYGCKRVGIWPFCWVRQKYCGSISGSLEFKKMDIRDA